MSITLMAYPMAFLIAPEKAPKEHLREKKDSNKNNAIQAMKNLKFIRVLSNITFNELRILVPRLDVKQLNAGCLYEINTGLQIEPIVEGKFVTFKLSGTANSQSLQTASESLFKELDAITGRNVRLLGSHEIFYYNYATDYKKASDIYKSLKDGNASQIFTTENNEIVATLDNQSVKYYQNEFDPFYFLEVEQKISIMNIGVDEASSGQYATYGLTNLKIQTNVKYPELKKLLQKAGYHFYPANGQTPLRSSYVTLNWVDQNGTYVAEFSGSNNKEITREAEEVFKKLNIAAGRDLRLINDTTTTVYTYNTNYTDKGVLLNTLYEHGAEEMVEEGDTVTCKLFGMEMKYYKQDSGAYALDITQISDKTQCEGVLDDLNQEYGMNLQEITYNKIKERLEQENLRLESETVLDDNSIVLTIEI